MTEAPTASSEPPAPPSGGSKAPEGGLKILLYVLSFLIPLAGVIIGVIFYTRDSLEEKQFGKICIILAVVNIGIGLVCGCIGLFGGILATLAQM